MPSPFTEKDRRSVARKILRGNASLSFGGGVALGARTTDISINGVGLVVPRNLNPGVACRVDLTLTFHNRPNEALRATAKVSYSVLSQQHDGFQVGLEFTDLLPSAIAALDRYLKD